MRLTGHFVFSFFLLLTCLFPASPSFGKTLDGDTRAALVNEMKASPDNLDIWHEGMHQLLMSSVRETDYVSRMSQSRTIVELIDQRLTLDAGKPLPEATQIILLECTSMLQTSIFILYEDNLPLQQLRNRIYSQIMRIPDCESMECAYIQAWASILEGTLTKDEKQRTRMFDYAYNVYDRIIRNPVEKDAATELATLHIAYIHALSSEAVLSGNPGRRATLLARADQHAEKAQKQMKKSEHFADIMPGMLNDALLRLNLSKAYCATLPGGRDARLLAAEKNLDATAIAKNEPYRYMIQAEMAVIQEDWESAIKYLELIPLPMRLYVLTVPSIRNAQNPLFRAYLKKIYEYMNHAAIIH